MVHIVTYDLHKPDRDYPAIEKVLKEAGSWAHPQGSVWFIDMLISTSDLVDRLKAAGDANDEYFVARMRKSWTSYNMDKDVVEWLKSPNRRWE